MTDQPGRSLIRAVVLTGLLVGTLDGLAAVVQFVLVTGQDPRRVFLYIASGVFGRPAFDGGPATVAAGVLFHYVFATGWTLLYFLLYPRVAALWRNWPLAGVAYGVVVWLGMNRVVIPLSRITPPPFDLSRALWAVAILVVCVGLPIAYSARRHFGEPPQGRFRSAF